MKRDALTHPKTLDLASRLNTTRAHAIGILTLLFDFTAAYSPAGDIGRHRDGAIARACDWTSEPEILISALVESGWLDRNDEYRLIVHDWPDHCEQWVRLKLQKLGIPFLSVYFPAEAIAVPSAEHSIEPTAVPPAEGSRTRPRGPPSLAKPSLASTTTPQSPPSAVASWGETWSRVDVGDEFFERVREEANRFARLKRCTLDRDLVWQACWVSVEFDRDCVAEICEKLRNGDVRSPTSYINGAMRKLCDRRGEDWSTLKKLVPPTPPVTPLREGGAA